MKTMLLLLLLLAPALSVGAANPYLSSQPPRNCPFEPSKSLTGLVFTGRHATYTEADGWYASWAADGNLYASFSDGTVDKVSSFSASGYKNMKKADTQTGMAIIGGDDPLHLTVRPLGVYKSDSSPYTGRYPCGVLVYNGVWYYGTYCLGPEGFTKHNGALYGWPWLGPFVGFRWSTDLGQTWTQTPCTPAKPLFGENGLHGEPVKIGAINFVDFGKNMEHSPDGKAYLVGHGASDGQDRRFAFNSWVTGDEIYLIRVTPSIQNMNDASKYEFFAGHDVKGRPRWSHDFTQIKPIARWRDNMGWAMMTYNAPLKKYLLCVTDGVNTVTKFNSYILESDQITGPWRLVTYLKDFGEQAYFLNFLSKFISSDGRDLWLCYGANYIQGLSKDAVKSLPEGSRYGLCLQEVRLTQPIK